jgi:hypothetical protein
MFDGIKPSRLRKYSEQGKQAEPRRDNPFGMAFFGQHGPDDFNLIYRQERLDYKEKGTGFIQTCPFL